MKGSIWLAVHFQKYWETAGGILNIISPQPLPAESWVHNLPKVQDPPQMRLDCVNIIINLALTSTENILNRLPERETV